MQGIKDALRALNCTDVRQPIQKQPTQVGRVEKQFVWLEQSVIKAAIWILMFRSLAVDQSQENDEAADCEHNMCGRARGGRSRRDFWLMSAANAAMQRFMTCQLEERTDRQSTTDGRAGGRSGKRPGKRAGRRAGGQKGGRTGGWANGRTDDG